MIDIRKEVQQILKKCNDIKEQNIYDKLCRQFINRTEINHLLNTFGINRFKIEGRDLSNIEFLINFDKYITNNESIYSLIRNNYEQKLNNSIFMNRFLD